MMSEDEQLVAKMLNSIQINESSDGTSGSGTKKAKEQVEKEVKKHELVKLSEDEIAIDMINEIFKTDRFVGRDSDEEKRSYKFEKKEGKEEIVRKGKKKKHDEFEKLSEDDIAMIMIRKMFKTNRFSEYDSEEEKRSRRIAQEEDEAEMRLIEEEEERERNKKKKQKFVKMSKDFGFDIMKKTFKNDPFVGLSEEEKRSYMLAKEEDERELRLIEEEEERERNKKRKH